MPSFALIGTGQTARGVGRRVLAGGHELTVVGADPVRAEVVAADIGGAGTVRAAVTVNETFDGLVVAPDGAAAVELAAPAGGARFVKAFKTTFSSPLTAGEVAGHMLDVLIAGDDEDAKGKVAALARDGGLNLIDTGPLTRARARCRGILHIGLRNTLGTSFGRPSTSSPD